MITVEKNFVFIERDRDRDRDRDREAERERGRDRDRDAEKESLFSWLRPVCPTILDEEQDLEGLQLTLAAKSCIDLYIYPVPVGFYASVRKCMRKHHS